MWMTVSATFFLCLLTPAWGEDLRFASIEGLGDQEVARHVVPLIFEKLGITITITPMPGKRAQASVVSGEMDGEIMRIYSYGQGNDAVVRVPVPFYQIDTIVFGKKDRNFWFNSTTELNKHRLVKVLGVKQTDDVALGMTHVHNVTSAEQMMRFLERDRADGALSNSINGLYVLKEMSNHNIIPVSDSFATFNLYCYLHKKHAHLVPKLARTIQEMKSSGELERIVTESERLVLGNYHSQFKRKLSDITN